MFRLLRRVADATHRRSRHLLRAIDFHLADVKEVALVGRATPRRSTAVLRAQLRPHLVLAGGAEGTERPELMAGRAELDGRAAAYVCERFACQRPVAEPAELDALLAGCAG